MKLAVLIFAVAVVAGVTGSPCQAPPAPPKCALPRPPPCAPQSPPDAPIKTGLVGAVALDGLGTIVNSIGIAGEDMKNSKDPLVRTLGTLFLPISDVGLLVTDTVVGGGVGDIVNYVAKAVKDVGFSLQNAGPVGALLASLLKPTATVVESLGGDELPK